MAQHPRKNLSRPVIGVTGNNKRLSPSWLCLRLSLWLAGGKAVRIHIDKRSPPHALDALVISGGDDIHPGIYGEIPAEKKYYDKERDALEIEYIEFALKEALPLFGICRGHQLINAVLGGTLFTDIKPLRLTTSNSRSLLPIKKVTVAPSCQLSKIVGERIHVNSLHNQAIHNVSAKLQSTAHDSDQIIQAIESIDGTPTMGVQWHPEYLWFLPAHFNLFRWIVRMAAKNKSTPPL